MIILLRHLAEIEIPDKMPVDTDSRLGAYLGTIKCYRNMLVHYPTNKLTEIEYSSAWTRLSQVGTSNEMFRKAHSKIQ